MSSPVKMDNPPLISVVMSVFNGADYVERSIKSILAQEEQDFEFIIINDGSTDDTAAVLNQFSVQDRRIKVFSRINHGLTNSLNYGLSQARGEFIARQDADDISYPDRFSIQLAMMREDPLLTLVGSCSDDIYENGENCVWPYHPPEEIKRVVFVKTPFPHSTAFMRAEACRALGGYDATFLTSQDMDLWMRMTKSGKIAMSPRSLIERHIYQGSISIKRRRRQFYDAFRARMKHAPSRPAAIYHSLRSMLIAVLPTKIVLGLKRISA